MAVMFTTQQLFIMTTYRYKSQNKYLKIAFYFIYTIVVIVIEQIDAK